MRVVDQVMHVAPDHLVQIVADHVECRLVDEGAAAFAIDAVNADPDRVEDGILLTALGIRSRNGLEGNCHSWLGSNELGLRGCCLSRAALRTLDREAALWRPRGTCATPAAGFYKT